METNPNSGFEYIIVGSGAGGGPLAARLAQAGKRVLVIEAGSDQAHQPLQAPSLEVTQVPSFHGVSTEHEDLAWRFFVKHYTTPPTGLDPKWHEPDARQGEDATHEGIFYPRAAALGGCTVHNAMITIAGPDSDWDELADFLDDDSWRSRRIRAYFERMERNEYSGDPTPPSPKLSVRVWESIRWLFGFPADHTRGRHGFKGWLHTSVTDITLGLRDGQLIKMLKAALWQSKWAGLDRAWTLVSRFLRGRIAETLDPNHARTQAQSPEGVVLVPLAVDGCKTTIHQNAATPLVQRGRRSSPRELLLEAQASHPENLTIWTDCLVTRVLFDDRQGADGEVVAGRRAVGVEYLRGAKLYRAHVHPSGANAQADSVRVVEGGEVILCGGAFNTPQLLMLSGIGDREQLAGHGIACRHHAPGVGGNLQDRYEVTVISEMARDFKLLGGATFRLPEDGEAPDPHLERWRKEGTGLYTSNGAVLGIFKRSKPELEQPDLFIFGIPLPFEGYQVGYSKIGDQHRRFTWAILKGHTRNHDGTVRLRSDDPRDTPLINFHYFNETSRPGRGNEDPDLAALVDGVEFVRKIARSAGGVVRREGHPGLDLVPRGDRQALRDWIRRDAWGHHACGTCRMGPDGDRLAVLDSRFRVRGVDGLRVVDASIFPKIPGYFIVTNIYVASEKAADVVLEDAPVVAVEPARPSSRETDRHAAEKAVYPDGLHTAELEAVQRRRRAAHGADAGASREGWGDDVVGLGLSGGGIRCATFSLGVLQAFARSGLLRHVDLLSTVSGGGYVGAFLGRLYDRLRRPLLSGERPANGVTGVERELTDPRSRAVGWLRKHGTYIAPSGKGDARLNIATFLRNLLSVHFVVGVTLFATFGLADLVRYGAFERVLAGFGLVVDRGQLPLGHLLERWLGPFFSPWFILFELLLFLLVLPRMIGYWLASQERREGYDLPGLMISLLMIGVLTFLGLRDGLALEPLLVAASFVIAFFLVEVASYRVRKAESAGGAGGPETQRGRMRNFLTYDLALALTIAGGALGFAVVDTVGHGLHQWAAGNHRYAQAFTAFIAGLAALIPVVQKLAALLASDPTKRRPSAVTRMIRQQLVAGGLAVLLLLVPLVFYSFAVHAAYGGGERLLPGGLATVLAVVLSLVLAQPKALVFANRSSLAQMYGARLARAYLGASNPRRFRAAGANVTEVIPGDDVSSIRDYRPHEAGGPLHLINTTVNQTVEFTSQRGNRDRKGENMAVSCLGVSVGSRWHSRWEDRQPPEAARRRAGSTKKNARLEPIDRPPGTDHPLVDVSGAPANAVEMLSLRQWIAISGAAISPGSGKTTSLGTALLLGLANLRTGYWWDSGIADGARDGLPELTFTGRLVYLLPRLLRTQSLLLFEWLARFGGPWERFWNLSDGAFFEDTGGYELVRRRVPRIILCDGSADPSYQLDGLAGLMRKARIDFGACIEPFTAEEVADYAGATAPWVGTVDDLRPRTDAQGNITGPSARHAALLWVRYLTGSQRSSVLLYIKATLTGDESTDVAEYHAKHPEFPHEGTADQSFDEAQWESYRQLGQHVGVGLFAEDPSWFSKIPLAPAQARCA